MPIDFLYPQALTLLLLLPLVWRYLTNRRRTPSTFLRLMLAVLTVLVLARPRLALPEQGVDLIVLADRSASSAGETEETLRELLPLIRHELAAGDRMAIIGFGKDAALEKGFTGQGGASIHPDNFADGSELAAALTLAANLREPSRPAALLYVGDGQFTGERPDAAASLAKLEHLPFWYRRTGRGSGLDVAARSIASPPRVPPRSAWLVRFSLYANAPCTADYTLSRNGGVISRDTVELRRGDNHFYVRDTAPEGELLAYRLQVAAKGDRVEENNIATALTRVDAAPRVLLVNHPATKGFLAQTLAAAAIPVDVVGPNAFPTAPALLSPYTLVILENCQLSSFPHDGVTALAEAVRSGMCSLLVTGGPNSFGMGGYHRSVLDSLLPVEMELRNELRRGNMAVAMALDRSGSMSMRDSRGRTKMDLANLGAAESILLLSEQDQVAVIAVDSQAHVIVPLSLADAPEALAQQTKRIVSMGGGIFCLTALKAAAEEVEKSDLANRHIILFADASDAEEQDGCIEFAKELRKKRIGISVVAMGEPTDSDAEFLRTLANAGGGMALFSSEASGLPALFTQEIMRVSRRGFIEERVTPALLPSLSLLGVQTRTAPTVDGYNISAAREGAEVFMRLDDEFSTPLLAWKRLGRSSVGAVLFEVEGEFAGAFTRWRPAPELLVSLARRLVPGTEPEGVKLYSAMRQGVAEFELELSPELSDALAKESITELKLLGPGGTVMTAPLHWQQPELAAARIRLDAPGHYLPLVDLPGAGLAAGPAVSVSYAAEFAPADPVREEALLARLAMVSEGGEAVDFRQVRNSARAAEQGGREISRILLTILIVLFLLELSGRRLLWFS